MIEAYALGALDGDDRAGLEAHLAAGCADCERALREARWLVSQLAYLAPESAPSPALKERLMRSVNADVGVVPFAQPKSKRPAVPVWIWAGVAALLLVTLYSGWKAYRLGTEVAQMHQTMTQQQGEHEHLIKQVAALEQEATMRAILTSPASTKIMLMPSGKDMPTLEAKWHSKLGIVVTGYQMPKLGKDRVLQLWLIPKEGGKPMPSDTFWPQPNGQLAKLVPSPQENIPDVKALAITEEPMGGSQQPTSTPMWVGAVS
jgi:anti-sigma-K factor RskA